MKSGLSRDELARIRAVLEAVPSVEKAVLFGSRAMGLARSNSDVDIMLYGDGLQMQDVMQIGSLLDETTLPYQFDLIRHDVGNLALLEHVRQYGEVIFWRKKIPTDKKTWSAMIFRTWGKRLKRQHVKYKTCKIKDIIEDIAMGPFGSNIKVDCFVSSGVPVLNGSNIIGFSLNEDSFNYVTREKAISLKKAVASRGDVVITHRGTLGQIVYIPQDSKHEKYVISQSQFRIKCKRELMLPEFLVYYFHSREGQHHLLSNSSQVGVPALARPSTTFQEIEIPIPDIKTQCEIVGTLLALDAKIANNTKINHHLEQMAQAIFKSWFVDFKPWGGVMPDDWREGTLSEVATVTMGQSPDGSSYNEDGIGTVFYQGRAEFGSRFPSRRLFTTQPKRMAAKGDVLMSVRAPVGDLNVAFESCCLGRGLAGIQSNNGCQSFILYTMFALKQQLNLFNGEGTVFGSINKNDMANLPVLIPTDNVLRQFEELVNPMDAAIETNNAESCNLQATRDSLLPRLMSGELSVADLGDAK